MAQAARGSPLSALVPSVAAHLVPFLLLDESAELAISLCQRDLKELRLNVIESLKKEQKKYDNGGVLVIGRLEMAYGARGKKMHDRNIKRVRAIIASGIYNFDFTIKGWTALHHTCLSADLDMLALLVSCPDASKIINAGCPTMGRTPLHFALGCGASDLPWDHEIKMLKLLLSVPGIDVNKEGNNADTPLDWAITFLGTDHPTTEILRHCGALHGSRIASQLGPEPAFHRTAVPSGLTLEEHLDRYAATWFEKVGSQRPGGPRDAPWNRVDELARHGRFETGAEQARRLEDAGRANWVRVDGRWVPVDDEPPTP